MKVPKFSFKLDNRIIYLLIWTIFVSIVLTVIGQLGAASSWIVLRNVGLGLSVVFSIVLLFLFRRTAVQPINNIVKMTDQIVKQDLDRIRTAIANLSQGDLSTQLNMKTKVIKSVPSTEIGSVVNGLNHMIAEISEISDEFNHLTETPCSRLCYVGADSFLEGRKCGDVLGEILNGHGQIGISTGSFQAAGLRLRRKGCESMLREKYPDIEIVEVHETNEAEEISYRKALEMIKKYPKISGIYVTEGATPVGVGRAIVEMGKVGQIKVIVHDLTDATMNYITEGVITATLGQDPYTQGHDPLIHLFNHIVGGWKPPVPRLLTQMDLVTGENYKSFWQRGRGIVQSQEVLNRLAIPVDETPEKSLRLVILGRQDSAFWDPVHEGALSAVEKLKLHNVNAEWILPEQKGGSKLFNVATYAPFIKKLIEEGVDGIAMVGAYGELVPIINDVVAKGIPVVLANSEPSSLRGLIYTVIDQANMLTEMSENLATSIYQAGMGITSINEAIDTVSEGINAQNSQVAKTHETLESLLTNIDMVSQEAERIAKGSEETASAVGSGINAMDSTLMSMRSIEKSVTDTSEIVDQLSEHSNQIDAIIDLIDDIASRVNILALNAAIEATKAGEFGSGFMVVAKEIRTLAKNTAEATRRVTERVIAVKNSIGDVQKGMNVGLKEVKQTAELTDQSGEALNKIKNLVETDQQRLLKISKSILGMQDYSHQVGSAMDSVAKVSERNVGQLDSVNNSTKEMSVQVNEVTKLAKLLEQMSQSELELLAKFRVGNNQS
ncbi:substrate-binding domain-containing protein [candidate division KSB1 bacterium]|nr:substrate-binding domain-containing protein [candidate division KSB1 bacterium]